MLTGIAGERPHPLPTPVVVSALFNNAGAITAAQSAASPDLGQDAVDSLFD